MPKPHDFWASLKLGQKHEDVFLKAHPQLTKHTKREADFSLPSGELVELKSDTYDPSQTPNFFFERYSNLETKKLGGVWQAHQNSAEFFVYYYPVTGDYYVFRTAALCATLNVIEKFSKQIRILNRGWITTGFLVLRKDMKPLMQKYNLKGDKKWKTGR